MEQRDRIKAVLNGGRGAVIALLGERLDERDVPAAPFIDSGLQRLSQKLGHRPDIKVDSRRDKDNQTQRYRAEKRERIVEAYDENSELDLDLPQASRWLVGYGFAVWVVRHRKDPETGHWYPHAELRDSYDCFPGYSGLGYQAQPDEMAIARRVDREWLAKKYPQYAADLKNQKGSLGYNSVLAISKTGDPWASSNDGAVVVEYYDEYGTWLVAVETGTLLEFSANPLQRGPRFVMAKRYSFDEPQGHYDQVLGLYKMIAQMNMMGVIATQDATFRETNITGRITSGKYKRGRKAYNYFEPGTRIERASADIPHQTWQQIDRLERHLRVGANYSTVDDAESPNSFVTGQGLDRLGQGGDNNVTEYQKSLRFALQRLDARRLEWDDQMYPDTKKPLVCNIGGNAIDETYTPRKHIAGHYRTRRVYGVMAGWDEPAKIVTGLQLLQGRIIDRETFQENLHGFENGRLINERMNRHEAEDAMMEKLRVASQQGDPRADMALIEIAEDPKNKMETLKKFFTPEEPEMSPEEEAMAAGMMGGGPQAAGPPESVATVLSRLEQSGGTEGGVQTVGQLPGR